MHVAVNGKAIVDGRIVLPMSREWIATIDVNSTEAISGSATISIADGAMQFVGTARSEVVNGRCKMRLTAGAGGITGAIAGKSYFRISARNLITDILADIGETLGPVSGLDVELVHWMRATGPASRELRVLFASLGLGWRMNADGTLWCGVESWPETSMKNETILREDPASGEYEVAANIPSVFPGETWSGRRVRTVTHTIAGSTLRTTLSTVTQ